MKADLSPSSVGARLSHLRSIAVLEDVAMTRRRLEADRPAPVPFADAVAQRLAELRALCALTEHLHARDRK